MAKDYKLKEIYNEVENKHSNFSRFKNYLEKFFSQYRLKADWIRLLNNDKFSEEEKNLIIFISDNFSFLSGKNVSQMHSTPDMEDYPETAYRIYKMFCAHGFTEEELDVIDKKLGAYLEKLGEKEIFKSAEKQFMQLMKEVKDFSGSDKLNGIDKYLWLQDVKSGLETFIANKKKLYYEMCNVVTGNGYQIIEKTDIINEKLNNDENYKEIIRQIDDARRERNKDYFFYAENVAIGKIDADRLNDRIFAEKQELWWELETQGYQDLLKDCIGKIDEIKYKPSKLAPEYKKEIEKIWKMFCENENFEYKIKCHILTEWIKMKYHMTGEKIKQLESDKKNIEDRYNKEVENEINSGALLNNRESTILNNINRNNMKSIEVLNKAKRRLNQ